MLERSALMSAKSKKRGGGRLPTTTVRARAEALLARTDLPYDKVVERVLEVFPKAKTSTKSVAWYASRLRASGVELPERQRASVGA